VRYGSISLAFLRIAVIRETKVHISCIVLIRHRGVHLRQTIAYSRIRPTSSFKIINGSVKVEHIYGCWVICSRSLAGKSISDSIFEDT
jgi:hypothetical protein